VLICGYLTFGRSFAYLGIPPLFIGEYFIARSLYVNHRRWIQRFLDDLFQMRLLAAGVGLTILWGLFEVMRSFVHGNTPTVDIIKTFAFNYYTIVLFIGMAYGADITMPSFLRFWKRFAYFYCAYGIAQMAFSDFGWQLPWAGVLIFNDPSIAALVPVGILALWPYLADWKLKYPVLFVSVLPMLYNPGRGAMLSMMVGVACVAMVSVQRVFTVAMICVGLVVTLSIVGPMIPGGRVEVLDPVFPISRLVATFDEDAAVRMLREAGYHAQADEWAYVARGTANWRKTIWEGVVSSLDTTKLQLIGHGHGTDLSRFTPHGEDIRTPHNFVIFAIFYTGAIGLGFFCLLIAGILMRGYYIPERNMRALLFALVLMMCMLAVVGNMFETPAGAIPFYLLCGIMLGMDYRRAVIVQPMMVVEQQPPPPPPPPVAPPPRRSPPRREVAPV